jgi:hypothetical protein
VLNPNGEGAEHNYGSDERWILGLVMFQYLCVVVVYTGYLLCCILVMFDVSYLLCCILVMFDMSDDLFDDM